MKTLTFTIKMTDRGATIRDPQIILDFLKLVYDANNKEHWVVYSKIMYDDQLYLVGTRYIIERGTKPWKTPLSPSPSSFLASLPSRSGFMPPHSG